MKIVRITTKAGLVFHCKPGTKVLVDNHHMIGDWEYVEMTEEEYNKLPATNESAAFFAT